MDNSEETLLVEEIRKLKKEKNVDILSHYYMPASLQKFFKDGGIADFVGDSLGLSLFAQESKGRHILFCGVKFMAETAVLVNPTKKVFMPDTNTGCSLAESITEEDLIKLRKDNLGIPIMGYINTYASTKKHLDVCCTSRNALKIAAALPSDKIIFIPDLYMGQNLAKVLKEKHNKELILWKGTCEVHEQFKNDMLVCDEDSEILLHWEVPAETVDAQLASRKGIVGSTGDILKYVQQSSAKKFVLASECDLAVSLQEQNKDKEFITPCIKCPYMKQNSLLKVLDALKAIDTDEESNYLISLSSDTIEKAKIPVLEMLSPKYL
jgi:quinolinate synthase